MKQYPLRIKQEAYNILNQEAESMNIIFNSYINIILSKEIKKIKKK